MGSIVLTTQTAPSEGGEGESPTLSRPKIIYIEANGDDASGEIGNPAKPFATGTAAYNAGVVTMNTFVLKFGFGEFSIITAEWTNACRAVIGLGAAPIDFDSPTVVTIEAPWVQGMPEVENAFGALGPTIENGAFYNLYLKANLVGQAVMATDGMTYDAGNGGSFTALCHGVVMDIILTGGGGTSMSGTANAGNNGDAYIQGSWKLKSLSAASVGLDGGDLRGAAVTWTSSLDIGRCSYPYTLGLTNDIGGNAAY